MDRMQSLRRLQFNNNPINHHVDDIIANYETVLILNLDWHLLFYRQPLH